MAESPYDTLKLVENKLDEFTVWCHENKLSINTGKTLLNNDRVHFVNEYTYLGAHLDSLLDLESQTKATLKIFSHKIIILSRMSRGYMGAYLGKGTYWQLITSCWLYFGNMFQI